MTKGKFKDAVEALRGEYKKNPAWTKVLDEFAGRERDQRRTTVDRLSANVGVGRGEIIEIFRKLETLGFGKFLVGRRGQPSRFEWDFSIGGVGRAASGETEDIEETDIDEGADDAEEGCVEHRFPLRRGQTLVIKLPENFTTAEANRLAEFVKALPLER